MMIQGTYMDENHQPAPPALVHIDLRALTPAHLEEARPFMGSCDYAAPCIIGTLIPPGFRRHFGGCGIGWLVMTKDIIVPEEQHDDIRRLQRAFDHGEWEEVEKIANRYMNQPKEPSA